MSVVVAHCRAGFEPEAAADLAAVAAAAGTTVEVDAPPGRGYVVATPRTFDAQRWPRALDAAPPVFVRSLFFGTGPHALFADDAATRGRPDRVAPLAALLAAFRRDCRQPGIGVRHRAAAVFGELRMETADTNDGKELSGLCRRLELPLAGELLADGALAEHDDADTPTVLPALHVLFAHGAEVYIGVSAPPWGSRWAMGIPRLRMPRGAPSRSTLKLAEAIQAFLGDQAGDLLRGGMKAVDLGAAPGGWTWQLVQRGLRVTAVDNGPLKGEVAEDPLVTHLRVDGLTYVPRRPVDWMVCDIVDQPSRIAALVARWIAEGHARGTIFNLKLPMKKRYDEMLRCRAIIDDALARSRLRHRLQLRQLYHDREEVTGIVLRTG
ncbi:MAG: 23S rRNA (cytidine(2498)-2'-O)-methyltransferase RlmM [Betaproteobacteria bacterium]|nr:23S rRNA (cytidine(2498)-2'-O)-methyltransferase RlmM [Betaproteobacteria bacterium]